MQGDSTGSRIVSATKNINCLYSTKMAPGKPGLGSSFLFRQDSALCFLFSISKMTSLVRSLSNRNMVGLFLSEPQLLQVILATEKYVSVNFTTFGICTKCRHSKWPSGKPPSAVFVCQGKNEVSSYSMSHIGLWWSTTSLGQFREITCAK